MARTTIDNRIKGQEVTILLSQDGELLDEFTEISNFSIEETIDIMSKGYLGEKTERKDQMYKGIKGSFEMDLATTTYFRFRDSVINKAKRITPDVEFKISAVLSFPNGETPTCTLPNVTFGSLPMDISGRADYIKIKLSFECQEMTTTY